MYRPMANFVHCMLQRIMDWLIGVQINQDMSSWLFRFRWHFVQTIFVKVKGKKSKTFWQAKPSYEIQVFGILSKFTPLNLKLLRGYFNEIDVNFLELNQKVLIDCLIACAWFVNKFISDLFVGFKKKYFISLIMHQNERTKHLWNRKKGKFKWNKCHHSTKIHKQFSNKSPATFGLI